MANARTIAVVNDGSVPLPSFKFPGMPVGFIVCDSTGQNWQLTASTATVDHAAVEKVAGNPQLRWLAYTGGGPGGSGTVTSVAAGATGLVAIGGTPTVTPTVDLAAAGAAGVIGATAAGTMSLLTGRQNLSVVMTGTSTRVDVTGSAVQNIDWTGLSGDTDGDYEIEFYLPSPSSGNLTLQPNQIATGGLSRGYFTNGVAMAQQSGGATLFLLFSASVNNHGTIYFRSKSGQGNRYYRYFSQDETATNPFMQNMSGYWVDTTTVLTSMRIHHSNATGIPVGSWFVLRRMGKI